MRKKRPDYDLDTTTTFANMNVEGFRWYDPSLKDGKRREKLNVTRKEYWAMVKGAFLAIGPYILGAMLVFGLLAVLAYLWLS